MPAPFVTWNNHPFRFRLFDYPSQEHQIIPPPCLCCAAPYSLLQQKRNYINLYNSQFPHLWKRKKSTALCGAVPSFVIRCWIYCFN